MRLEPTWRQPFGILPDPRLDRRLVRRRRQRRRADHRRALAGRSVLYYVVAGIAWILPLKPLLRWMETGRWRA